MADTIKHLHTKDSPEKFKKTYLLLAFSCLILSLVLALVIINRNSKHDLAHATEVNAAKIAAALVSSESETLRIEEEGSEATVAIPPDSIPAFDRRIRAFLKPFDIVKIKVYSKEMKIIYCTEQALIGKLDSSNKRLKTALEGTVQTVMKDRQSITDLAVEKRYEVDLAEVYVPVRNRSGQVAGVFELYTDITHLKREVKDNLVSSILYLIGAILSISLVSYVVIVKESEALRTAYQLLETTAITDSLTGIFNRGHLLLRAEELYALMKRSRDKVTHGVGLGVVMIDIDHFKKVNDTHGHLAGDSVLSSLAARIEAVLRPYDIFGRYGGEEFMVFLPNTTLEETEQIARRVIDLVSATPFESGAQSLAITVSAGGTWTDAGVESFDTVLCRADELLYEAKRSGRNQAVFKLETATHTEEV